MKALVLLLAVSGSALAADADLLRCRAIPDVAGRVACYDAIPVAAGAPSTAAPAQTSVTAAAPQAAAPAAGTEFGLSAQQLRKAEEPKSVESTVVGTLEGWGPNSTFTLANGQVWRVVDGSSEWFMEQKNPKVVITRNSFGTYFFDVDGSKQPPRVRRIQ